MYSLFACLVVVEAAAPGGGGALEQAKRQLAEGKLDEVLFALEGKSFEGRGKADAAAVLAAAAQASFEKEDHVLSFQFVQMALRLKPTEPLALEVGARTCLAQQQFDPAERYSDQLLAARPGAPGPRLLRAEIAIQQGEWSRVVSLVKGIAPKTLSSADRAHLQRLIETATRELGEREAAREQSRALARQLEAEMERIARERPPSPPPAVAKTAGPVILYSTAWCGYCKAAARWFRSRKIDFVEKDIEKDSGAADELRAKLRAAKRSGGGVPWIDVGGQLIQGFDRRALEELFP